MEILARWAREKDIAQPKFGRRLGLSAMTVVGNNLNVRFLIAKPSPGTMGTMSATFEQWLEFVFNNPVRKHEWYWDEGFDSRWEALESPMHSSSNT